jgi:hypothetical protein
MSIHKTIGALAIAVVLLATAVSSHAQDVKGKLGTAAVIKCTFSVVTSSSWSPTAAEAKTKPSNLTLQFEGIKADEGTAELKSTFGGKYDIIVRYSEGYLHFIQSFLDGPLYTTTVLEKKTASGKLKAVHSRHEYTDVALPGFTSSPEQYIGECEILR